MNIVKVGIEKMKILTFFSVLEYKRKDDNYKNKISKIKICKKNQSDS